MLKRLSDLDLSGYLRPFFLAYTNGLAATINRLPEGGSVIQLKQVEKTYHSDDFALRDINLDIQAGEIFGVIGRSGAGKSTLVRCINLLERPTQGEVWIAGQNMMTLPEPALRQARQKIGMIFQHFNLLDSRTVLENVLFPLEVSAWPRKQALKRVLKLLKLVGLSEYQHAYPNQLSGGQKQRVAIARALANKPNVLLSDEATSALDPETTVSILQLLKKINQELGVTIVLITHEMDVIKTICQRAAILEKGRLAEVAPVIDIFSRPQAQATRSLTRAALHSELPPMIQAKLLDTPQPGAVPVVRLAFVGEQVNQPLLSTIAEKYAVESNILHATIEWVNETAIGVTICELLGGEQSVEQALQYIKQQQVQVEVNGWICPS